MTPAFKTFLYRFNLISLVSLVFTNDPSLTVFIGSAIYVFCILPLGVPPNTNSTPTLMNLSFTLDGEPAGSFFHEGSTNTGGFQSNVPVLARGNLSNSAHNLLVDLGPNSVFLFDYYVFSQSNGSNIDSPAPATGIISESSARWVVFPVFFPDPNSSTAVLAHIVVYHQPQRT